MSEYLERTNASKPTFGDYVTLPMKCYGGPNEHFVHEVLSSPFISNSWRNVPIDARDPEEHLHDTSETVVAVRAQGVNPRDAHIFAVRLPDVLPMKGDKWAWQESPLRTRIAELEEENDRLQAAWFVEETICPDGSLKPKASALLSRIAELELELNNTKFHAKALQKLLTERMDEIAELKAESERFTAHDATERQDDKWIPVSERLPETDGQYIGYTNTGLVGTHWLVDGHFVVTYSCEQNWLTTPTSWILKSASGGDVYVTHWMPLPEPPIVYGKVCEE